MKRPAFQFYPGDWRKDPALSVCSLAARGLWIEAMCIAHESDPYGHLAVAGKPMTAAQLARLVGESPAVVAKLIAELESAEVFSRSEGGAIYCRRMVRDEKLRATRAECGRLGGNPKLLGDKVKQKVKQTGNQSTKQEPTPSSSSSSSTTSDADASAGKPAAPPAPKDVVFALGVPLLTTSGVKESNARSFLAMQVKAHGDAKTAEALQACAEERPVEPISWLQARLGPIKTGAKAGRHAGFENLDYRNGVTADGHLA